MLFLYEGFLFHLHPKKGMILKGITSSLKWAKYHTQANDVH